MVRSPHSGTTRAMAAIGDDDLLALANAVEVAAEMISQLA